MSRRAPPDELQHDRRGDVRWYRHRELDSRLPQQPGNDTAPESAHEVFRWRACPGSPYIFFQAAGRSNRPYLQMETFESPSDRSFLEYDASGKITRSDTFDPEAQVITDEFKRPPY